MNDILGPPEQGVKTPPVTGHAHQFLWRHSGDNLWPIVQSPYLTDCSVCGYRLGTIQSGAA